MATGKEYRKITCSELKRGAVSDGFVPVSKAQVGNYSGPNKPCRYVALAVTPQNISEFEQDYHWFRLMKRGIDAGARRAAWWHKPGSLPVLKTDWADKPIMDVDKANRGPYTKMCGYFKYCLEVL